MRAIQFNQFFKKSFILSVLFCGTLGAAPSWSATTDSSCCDQSVTYLQGIQTNTTNLLAIVNDFPVYLSNLSNMAMSWLKSDDSDTTSQMQGNFANLGSAILNDTNAQNASDLQLHLTSTMLGLSNNDPSTVGASLSASPNSPNSIIKNMPYINGMIYASLLGKPLIPVQQQQNNPYLSPAYAYLLNASGLNISHGPPPLGHSQPIINYTTYYKTVMAVESFNAYVLSNLFAESQNGGPFTTAQASLIQQASQSSWLTQIASEELGKVLRQILLFQSQTYVLLSQLIQTQKQQLVAQTMTNSILILNNQQNESLIYGKAIGISPR